MGHLDNSCIIIIFQVMYQVLRAPIDGRVLLAPEGRFLNQLGGVSKSNETLCRVFDIASQTINNSWRKSKQTFPKFPDTSHYVVG